MVWNFLGLGGLGAYLLYLAKMGGGTGRMAELLIGFVVLIGVYTAQASAFRYDNTLKVWREQAIEGVMTTVYMFFWLAVTRIGGSLRPSWYTAMLIGVVMFVILVLLAKNMWGRLRQYRMDGKVLIPKERLMVGRLFDRNWFA